MISRSTEIDAIRASGEFDDAWYVERYPDVAQIPLDPLSHYVVLGVLLGRNPGPKFDTDFYLRTNPDVVQAGLNPLFHYISSGRAEGRKPCAEDNFNPLGLPSVTTSRPAQFRVDCNASIKPDEDWLVFVAYSSDGGLSACQKYQIQTFRKAGYAIVLLVNTDNFFNLTDPGAGDVDIQIVRENLGFDFGAWRHAIELIGGLARARSVTFTNDSIMPANGSGTVATLRASIAACPADVVFMTQNLEVRPHSQSYFFSFNRTALEKGGLSQIAVIPYYTDKDALIYAVEIHFADHIRKAGFTLQHLFEFPGILENPTIHHWERLLDDGFPFLKVQLITAGIVEMQDPRLQHRLDAHALEMLRDHCGKRGIGVSAFFNVRNCPPKPAFPGAGLFNEYGAQQAYNVPAEQNRTIKLPLTGLGADPTTPPAILAIIHGFYTDVSAQILDEIASLGLAMRLIVTTDTAEKAAIIDRQIAAHRLTGKAVLCPNRGRDIAPFIIEGAKHLGDAEIILHLHTKKSPHDSVYANWGDFLRKNLIGSRETALSILKILAETDVGLVYSDHFPEVVGLRNWGYDFVHAQLLLKRIGSVIDGDMPLEFPTSSMFWAKRSALYPLFAIGLDYNDFDEELGQVDGTLAHGIERSLLHIVEHGGYSYTKVTALDVATEPASPLLRLDADSLPYAFERPMPRLNGGPSLRSNYYDAVPEIYPVGVSRSRKSRHRLNVLLPTMKPEKVYGGITTALTVVRQVADAMPSNVDLRVLITSDTVNRESVEELSQRLGRSISWVMPDDDVTGNTIAGIAENQNIPICLRSTEMYIATAWWTADLGFRLIDRQQELFSRKSRMAYIIQDYEPGFYAWSNTYALAEATYHRGDETTAILNSEELAGYVLARYQFADAYHVPYKIHPRLADLLAPTVPDKRILAYGRPSVSRNCFDLICEGLRIWQTRNPMENSGYEVIFAGEEFDASLLSQLANASNAGKLPIDEYASALNRSAIGISLMVSPHPSYPPLEMATAGCVTITNAYEGKDLRKRSDNFISLDYLSPQMLADALDQAVKRVNLNRPSEIQRINDLPASTEPADYRRIADGLLRALES